MLMPHVTSQEYTLTVKSPKQALGRRRITGDDRLFGRFPNDVETHARQVISSDRFVLQKRLGTLGHFVHPTRWNLPRRVS